MIVLVWLAKFAPCRPVFLELLKVISFLLMTLKLRMLLEFPGPFAWLVPCKKGSWLPSELVLELANWLCYAWARAWSLLLWLSWSRTPPLARLSLRGASDECTFTTFFDPKANYL